MLAEEQLLRDAFGILALLAAHGYEDLYRCLVAILAPDLIAGDQEGGEQ